MNNMKKRYRLILRGNRGKFYCVDTMTGKRTSLETQNRNDAQELVDIKNRAVRQPEMNLQIAQIYLQHCDPALKNRTWQDVINQIVSSKNGPTKSRWRIADKDSAFDSIRNFKLLETTSQHFWEVLKEGTVSTNVYLRRLHNYAIGMHWLPWPVLPKLHWPKIEHKEKRAITFEEHQKIIGREHNPATRAFYQLLWHLGGSQTDVAELTAEDIDWNDRTISYCRTKTRRTAIISFGEEVAEILRSLPQTGQLFPVLARVRATDRAQLFAKRLATVDIKGVTLHCYRYAWAERAKAAGYPERFAMQALGHTSKAVHHAYSKKAHVKLPPLEEYEQKIVRLEIPLVARML